MEEASDSPRSNDASDIYGSPSDAQPASDSHLPPDDRDSGQKRKLPDEESQSPEKRRKTKEHHVNDFREPRAVTGLPMEMWQGIFKQLHPLMLGRLLQVNRAFYCYLTDTEAHRWMNPRKGRLQVLDAETIWSDSRKLHCPNMPRPLIDCSERDMWRLILGQRCTFCAKVSRAQYPPEKPFESGPGPEGVRITWPFAVRTCGQCLESHSQKETTLLFSTSSALLPALPFAFVTQDLHVIPSILLKDANATPPTLQVAKYYYKKHVEEIERQLQDTQALGPAAAEEWSKGLVGAGKRKLLDAARWERFESKGGIDSIKLDICNSRIAREASPFSFGQRSPRSALTPSSASGILIAARSTGDAGIPRSVSRQYRASRDLRDINQSKAQRRAEIERRCELLQPPLTRNVLQFMESFQAAVQIPMGLTDHAWDLLLPRLLAQRPEAEKIALNAATKGKVLVVPPGKRRADSVDSKEAQDQARPELQVLVQDRLGYCADKIIRETWRNGKAVTNANCPSFAADVLLGARQLYLSESSQVEPGAKPYGRLVLDHMKWIFDFKIRPITEKFRREIFLCNDCVTTKKFYGFEAVIQHFGAKHTNYFSVGNVTVHWREADWPEHPPFRPNPGKSTNKGRQVQHQRDQNSKSLKPHAPIQQQTGLTNPVSHGISLTPRPLATSQMSPRPNNGISLHYGSGWTSPTSIPPHAKGEAQARPGGVQMQHPGPSSEAVPPIYNAPRMLEGASMHYPGSLYPMTAMHPETENWPAGARSISHQARTSSRLGNERKLERIQNNEGYYQSTQEPANLTQLPYSRNVARLTQTEMDALSGIASDIWSSTAGIKDLPTSLRVYVVIFYMQQTCQFDFGQSLDLELFEYVIRRDHATQPIKNAAGLACNMCALQRDGKQAAYQSYYSRIDQRDLYNLSSLINHFLQTHASELIAEASHYGPHHDWKRLMIELPEPEFIDGLENAPGMDADKKRLFSHVFPSNRGFRTVSIVPRVPYDDQNRRFVPTTNYHDTEVIGRNMQEGSQRGLRDPPSSRYFQVLADDPDDEVAVGSTRFCSRAVPTDGLLPVPEVRRRRASNIQLQGEIPQEGASRTQPLLYTEDERGQRSYYFIREPAPEPYQPLPPEGYVYMQGRNSSIRPMDGYDDAGLLHNTDRYGLPTIGAREDGVSPVHYISRSKNWSPAKEGIDDERLGLKSAPSEQVSRNTDLSWRKLAHEEPRVIREDKPQVPLAERQLTNAQCASRKSDISRPFHPLRLVSNTEHQRWLHDPASPHIPSPAPLADPHSNLHSEIQSQQPSGIPTPTRINEQHPYPMIRSSSRKFDRYEAARRHLDHTASQSPLPGQSAGMQDPQRRDLSPTQSKEQLNVAQGEPHNSASNHITYNQTLEPGERREQVVFLPIENHDEHNNVSHLTREPSDKSYEQANKILSYDNLNTQGHDYIHYHANSPQDRMHEQPRVIYVPEGEILHMERAEPHPEGARASVPPEAAL